MACARPEYATIHSPMASASVYGELVEMYVDEMPDRIAALERAFDSGDMEGLQRAAHQMKGAAGSYGFDHWRLWRLRSSSLFATASRKIPSSRHCKNCSTSADWFGPEHQSELLK
ncbi:MAG: Hpt domain-containing protein [Pirellulaceae bacterium]|nr:Hpt domain-containing protein [Pirellulaceae bacterium]